MQDSILKKYKLKWLRVKKVSPVFVSILEQDQNIQTLEGSIQAKEGDILCKGIEGEIWAIKNADLERCYKPTGNIEGEWQEHKPAAKHCNVWAAELNQPIEINTLFGILIGKKGDYILKEVDPDFNENMRFWIVKKSIFLKTYKPI